MTVDDKPQELVVKVNNTLKRVNPIMPPKDALLYQSPAEYQSPFVGGAMSSAPPPPPSIPQDLCYATPDDISTFYLNGSSDGSSNGLFSRQVLTTGKNSAEKIGGGRSEEEPVQSNELSASGNGDGQQRKSR